MSTVHVMNTSILGEWQSLTIKMINKLCTFNCGFISWEMARLYGPRTSSASETLEMCFATYFLFLLKCSHLSRQYNQRIDLNARSLIMNECRRWYLTPYLRCKMLASEWNIYNIIMAFGRFQIALFDVCKTFNRYDISECRKWPNYCRGNEAKRKPRAMLISTNVQVHLEKKKKKNALTQMEWETFDLQLVSMHLQRVIVSNAKCLLNHGFISW